MGERKGGLLEERGLNGLGGVEGGRRGVIDFSPPRREKREEKGEIRRLVKEVVGEGGRERKRGKRRFLLGISPLLFARSDSPPPLHWSQFL